MTKNVTILNDNPRTPIQDIKIPNDPIPVTVNFDSNKMVGSAKVFKDGDQIKAELNLTEEGKAIINDSRYVSFSASLKEEEITLRELGII